MGGNLTFEKYLISVKVFEIVWGTPASAAATPGYTARISFRWRPRQGAEAATQYSPVPVFISFRKYEAVKIIV